MANDKIKDNRTKMTQIGDLPLGFHRQMRFLFKEDDCIISIVETPAHFLTPAWRTMLPHSQSPLQSTCQIQLMEKGIWNSLVGKSDYQSSGMSQTTDGNMAMVIY